MVNRNYAQSKGNYILRDILSMMQFRAIYIIYRFSPEKDY